MKKDWSLVGSLSLIVVIAIIAGAVFYHSNKSSSSKNDSKSAATTVAQAPPTSDQIIKAINEKRREASLAPLASSSELQVSSQLKCDDMVKDGYFEHVNPNTKKQGYTYIFDSLPTAGYASENLESTPLASAKGIVDNWMGSTDHRNTILTTDYTLTGIAVCKSTQSDVYYIVEHFATLKPTLTPQTHGALCNDGTSSDSVGRGACSHHEGVDHYY